MTFRAVVNPDLEVVLDQRLENFCKSTATSLYHMDEVGILQVQRLSQAYQANDASQSVSTSSFQLVP
jgi:hypothetical protein